MNGGAAKASRASGYTIIEVMIFLAISGVMFIMAAVFIQGKQQRAEFTQGMHDTNAAIQSVINDVANGFYPSRGDFKCTAALNTAPTFPPSGQAPEGTNQGCVFMGKVLQFDASANPSAYRVYSVAGRQYAVGSTSIAPGSFAQALPRVVDASTENDTLDWGLSVTGLCDLNTLSTNSHCNTQNSIGALGFFGSFDASQGQQSGAQLVGVTLVPGSQLGDNDSTIHQDIINMGTTIPPTVPESNPNILLCFDGGDGQHGAIVIGGSNGQQLSTDLQTGDQSELKRC